MLILGALLPAYGVLMTYVRSGSLALDGDLAFITSGIFLSHSLLLADTSRTRYALVAFQKTLYFFAIFVILAALFEVIGIRFPGVEAMQKYGNAVVTSRNYGGCLVPYVYMVASPLLLFGAARSWFEYFETRAYGPLVWGVVFAIALLFSGTRGNMLMAVVSPIIFWVWYRKGLWSAAGCFVIAIVLIWAVARFSPHVSLAGANRPTSPGKAEISLHCLDQSSSGTVLGAMVGPAEHSNSIKLAYLPAYLALLSDPSVLAFGQGFNARAWSAETRSMLPPNSHITELIYPDLIRIFGLPVTVGLLLLLAWQVLHWRKFSPAQSYCAAGWGLYLVLAASNPYIFSSNGMLLFALILAAYYAQQKNPGAGRGI